MKLLQGARLVTDGRVLTGMDVAVENGRVTELLPHDPLAKGIDLGGLYLAPGFIDLHCHGGGGAMFVDAGREDWLTASRTHAEGGTAVLYPTISAVSVEGTVAALEAYRKYAAECPLMMPGVHLEGPYFDPQSCGAQDPDAVHGPREEEYLPILEEYAPIIARWDYAPEHDTDLRFLRALNRYGVKPAVGHSAAEYDHLMPAYREGCDLITHLYSCTSTVTRHGGFRHLGIIETAYLLDEMDVEAIGDGCHLPAELMQLIVKLKGPEHVALISDSIRYCGMESSGSAAADKIPYLIEDGVAKLLDRSAFAGSIATTGRILASTVSAGISLPEVVRMLTATPARIMGLTDCGRLAKGCRALFTVFDRDLKVVRPEFGL